MLWRELVCNLFSMFATQNVTIIFLHAKENLFTRHTGFLLIDLSILYRINDSCPQQPIYHITVLVSCLSHQSLYSFFLLIKEHHFIFDQYFCEFYLKSSCVINCIMYCHLFQPFSNGGAEPSRWALKWLQAGRII